MPFAINGTLAVPDGSGPFPVVVVLHGRHPGCHFASATVSSMWPCAPGTETRFDQGLAYLAQALAAAGYLVLIPNLNAAYANAYGMNSSNRNALTDERSLQIVEAHLKHLAVAHQGDVVGFPLSLKGQLRPNQLAFLGHSLGGGVAVLEARRRLQLQASPSAEADLGPAQALLLVSPTPSRSAETEPEAYQLPDVPTSLLIGGCDRDIFDLSSLYYFETAYQDQNRQTPVSAVLLLGANHNFFNAAVGQDDYYRQPDNAPLCNPQQSDLRLSRVDQETFLVQYTLDFLAHTLGKGGQSTAPSPGGPNLRETASDGLYGFPVLTNLALPAVSRKPIVSLSGGSNPSSLPTSTDSIDWEICPSFQPCGNNPYRHPQFPTVLRLTWGDVGGQIQFSVPPETDLSGFHSLQLRLASVPSDATIPAVTGFAVVLRDRSGHAVRVEVPVSTPALRQLPSDSTQGMRRVQVYPSRLTIPLLQFRGVDLRNMTTVELVFDPGTHGQLYVAGMEFVGE
jgi:dienelactone hydrolase